MYSLASKSHPASRTIVPPVSPFPHVGSYYYMPAVCQGLEIQQHNEVGTVSNPTLQMRKLQLGGGWVVT